VTTASTATDALRLINEQPVQLVILDINLGDTSGLDLLEPIRKNTQTADHSFLRHRPG